MRTHSIPTDLGSIYPCSRKAINDHFTPGKLEWISFGAIGRYFQFDDKTENRPTLSGIVVASLTYNPEGTAHLCLYPIKEDQYGDAGKQEFASEVLVTFSKWLDKQSVNPENTSSRHKSVIADWTGTTHLIHQFDRLYKSN